MKYTDFFNIQIQEREKVVLFENWGKPINLSDGEKSSIGLSLDDIKSVPTKFKLYFIFTLQFQSAVIRQKFEKEQPQTDVQQQIQKTMSAKPSGMISIEPKFVDYEKFYYDVISQMLSAESIFKKLDQYFKAGTFSLPDFSIKKVDYPLVDGIKMNDATLWKQYITKDRKNLKASPIKLKFGYSIELYANNKLKMYSRTDVMELAKTFIPEFEQSILKDAEYFSFSKNVPTGNVKEQNIFTVPLDIWKPGSNDPLLYIEEQDLPSTDDAEGEEEKKPTLKGDAGKKIVGHIISAINFAIGKFNMRELRPGRILSGPQELIRIVKHAYQIPPAQKFPTDFTLTNLQRWLNMHDPTMDGIPIKQEKSGMQIVILKEKDIEDMKKEKEKIAKEKGLLAP